MDSGPGLSDWTQLDAALAGAERIITHGENGTRNLVVEVDPVTTTEEDKVNMRWPGAFHEKMVLERRLGKPLNWEKVPVHLDRYLYRFDKALAAVRPIFFAKSKRGTAKSKRSHGNIQLGANEALLPMCIGEYYALALLTAPFDSSQELKPHHGGTVWSYDLARIGTPKAAWVETKIKLGAYVTSCIFGSRLYAINGDCLSCYELRDGGKEVLSENIVQKFQLPIRNATSFIRVSIYGFVLIGMSQLGFVLLHHDLETSQFLLVHFESPLRREHGDPRRELRYTAASLELDSLVLGTSDGTVEFWKIRDSSAAVEATQLQNTELSQRYYLKLETAYNYFQNQVSGVKRIEIKMSPNEQVITVLQHGRRLFLSSPTNRVVEDLTPGMGKILLPKSAPVVSANIYGDVLSLLCADGSIAVGHVNASKSYFVLQNGRKFVNHPLPLGQQLITCIANCVVALLPNGVLLAIDQQTQ